MNDDDAFLDTFNFVPVVVSYCSRSNHETTKLHNPAVSYATVDGRSGGVRDSYGYDTLLVASMIREGCFSRWWIDVSEAKLR
jgi:hypothetical protein